jgi:Holliday junction resolvase
MSKLSKDKGKRGEREVAALMREYGFEAVRGQQHSGSPDSPDVKHNMMNFHVEVKRAERFRLFEALAQARADAKPSDVPLVFHRMNNTEWVIIMSARDFLKLINEELSTDEQ